MDMKDPNTSRTDTGRTGQTDSYELSLPDRHVLSVCEHFSFRPLISCDCLNINRHCQPHVYFDRYFARYETVETIENTLWDESFDLIICEDSYPYFSDLATLADEIYRLLKPGGFCYFSGNTRPPISGGEKSDRKKYYRTLSKLRRELSSFWVHDYGPLIQQNPAAFNREHSTRNAFARCFPDAIVNRVYPRLGEFVWVLTKMK